MFPDALPDNEHCHHILSHLQSTMRVILFACCAALAAGHGAMVSPLSRNAVDHLAGVNTQRCSNITGDECQNGQASFWYSQGCFIGCPTCDHLSGRNGRHHGSHDAGSIVL